MDEATKEEIVANIETEIQDKEVQIATLHNHLKAVEDATARVNTINELMTKLASNARLAYWDDEISNWHDMEFYTGDIDNTLVMAMLTAHRGNLESELVELEQKYTTA